MKMIELYRSILSLGSLRVDSEGMVSAAVAGSTVPYMVDGKQLVLPTPQNQANSDFEKRVMFHPLQENILRSESKVMERYRNAVNIRMNYVLGLITQELLHLSVDTASHKRLNPDQTQLLTKTLGADEKTLAIFQNLLKVMGMDNKDKCFVHLYLKRGGMIQGKKYNRACIVSFPLYEELLKDDKQVFGVMVSKKHKAAIIALLEFVLPNISTPQAYDAGSESDIAPFLDCLMKAIMKLASNINQVIDDYKDFIEKADELRYEDDWVETFDNLALLLPEIRSTPMQAGNEGSAGKAAAATPAAAAPIQNVSGPAAATWHAPAPVQMPAATPAAAGTWGGTAPTSGGPVRTADGKIDFSASIRSNPQMAAAMGQPAYGNQLYPGYNPPPPPGPHGSRMGAPRWDQPVQPQWGQPMMSTGTNPGMMNVGQFHPGYGSTGRI